MSTGKNLMVCAALAGGLMTAGCGTTGSNQQAGTVVGAGAGAVAGSLIARGLGVSPLAGAIVGGVIGGAVGNAIGAALDEEERRQLMLATQSAAATGSIGKRVAWQGSSPAKRTAKKKVARVQTASAAAPEPAPASEPQIKASGWVVPVSEKYQSASGETCRDMQQHAEKDGKVYEQKVTACLTKSGWQIPS